MSPPPPLLASCIPGDVWAAVVLEMLDLRDMVAALNVALKDAPLPVGAAFVATRVLGWRVLAWLAMQGIPVVLLAEIKTRNNRTVWTLNGKAHRSDGDLPALLDDGIGGKRVWYRHGRRHRDGGRPALESLDGYDHEWWVDGKRHRDGDLPAVVHGSTSTYGYDYEWYFEGKRHRDGGLPAVERAGNGDREWWVRGKRHRDGGLPAVEKASNGGREWWVRGKLHRDGGLPAVVVGDIPHYWQWWVHGKRRPRPNDLNKYLQA